MSEINCVPRAFKSKSSSSDADVRQVATFGGLVDAGDASRIQEQVFAKAHAGDDDGAWSAMQPLLDVLSADLVAARATAFLVSLGELDRERRLEVATRLLAHWGADLDVITVLGEATEVLYDRGYLNASPPSDPFFAAVARALNDQLDGGHDIDDGARIARGLVSAARVCGRSHDEMCERAHNFMLEHCADDWTTHYNYGLFLKNRGRFSEGLRANERAAKLGAADENSVIWNLGICATAAGEGEAALQQWRRLGTNMEMGSDGLPTGGWAPVQVRLAQRPVAERTATTDEPGLEETIWVERLSPCHGQVCSALYQELGVDFGDLVLFDGAPILSRQFGDRVVPVFPHLATIRSGDWSIYEFAATQSEAGQIAALGEALPGEATLYVHTEMFRTLCSSCWEKRIQTHDHDETTHLVVTGKLCVPPSIQPVAVSESLTELLRETTVQVFVPRLRTQTGDPTAEQDAARFAMLIHARKVANDVGTA